jgi:two-component system nitrogen regulation sensor histidine kinase NtrY
LSLRARFVLYLTLIHLVFGVAVFLLLSENRLWLLAVEGFFVLSFAIGLGLVIKLFEPIRLIRSGVELMKARDFGTRFRELGQSELDPLIRVYNEMANILREERIRGQEQEQFLDRILQVSPTGVLVLDLEGRITMTNPSAALMLQRSAEELRGERLAELGSAFAGELAGLAENESRLLALRGARRVRCRALHFMDRGFARRFLLLDELTQELHRSEKQAYEKLIRMMSHEVNNTAGAVGSLLESCLAYSGQLGESDREDFAKAMSVAIGRTDRMNDFMQGFADVIRLPAPSRQPVPLAAMLAEVHELMREQCAARNIVMHSSAAPDLMPVAMDIVQMEQVFINLLKNAIEAVDEDGEIEVRLELDLGRQVLRIRDSGPGIDPAVEGQLFTPFFTNKPDGRGIGLTLVQEILLGHGFDYSLENAPGGGAEFRIVFGARQDA